MAVTEGGGPEAEDREKKCVGAKAYPLAQVTLPCSLLDPHSVGSNPRPKFKAVAGRSLWTHTQSWDE